MYLQKSNSQGPETGGLTHFLPVFTRLERYAWVAGSFGIVFILLLSTVLTLDGFVSRDKYVLVALMLGLFPALSLLSVTPPRALVWLTRNPNPQIFLFLNLTTILIGLIWFSLGRFNIQHPPFSPGVLSVSYVFILALIAAVLYGRRNVAMHLSRTHPIALANHLLVLVVPVLLVAAVVLPANWYLYSRVNKLAGYIGVCLAFATLALWKLPPAWGSVHKKKYVTYAVGVVVFLSPFLMMDALLSYDALHYTAYLGPSTAVAAGRIPLVDVFCQYGLSYLVYNIGFAVLPSTYHAAALMTTFLSALYLLCALVMLRKLISSDWAFLMLGATLPFFFWMTYHYGPNMTPSHGGMRYLPIFLVAMSLILIRENRLFSALSIGSIFLAWAWSFEAALYSSFIYVVFLIARAGAESGSKLKEAARLLIRSTGKLIGLLAIFVMLVSTVYLVTVGTLPRYDLYLSIVLSYVGSDPFMDYSFFQDGFYAWIPVLAAYFVAALMVVRMAFAQDGSDPGRAGKLGVIFALGVSVGIYCLLSTQSFILKAVLIPFYLLLYWAMDTTMLSKPKGAWMSASAIGLAPVFVLLWFMFASVAWSNFNSPPAYGTPNASVLRHLVSFGRPVPVDFVDRLNRSCPPSGGTEIGNACEPATNMPDIHYEEFRDVLNRWQATDTSLFTFHVGGTIMEALFNKPHTLPLSFSYVEGFSPQLFKYIVERSRLAMETELKAGSTVVLPKNLYELNELDWALLKNLAEIWALEQIDQTANFQVYRLVLPGKAVGIKLLELPKRPLRKRNSL